MPMKKAAAKKAAKSEEAKTLDSIRKVLAKYFEEHSNGTPSKTYCSYFSAQDAIDEISDLVGDY